MVRKNVNKAQRKTCVVGKLRFLLHIDCSEKTYWKLSIAAGRFVQANYKALLALLTSKPGSKNQGDAASASSVQLPFYITVSRTPNRKTQMSVSASADKHNLLYFSSTVSDDLQMLRSKKGGKDYRVCVEGSIGLSPTESAVSLDTISCTNATVCAGTFVANLVDVMHTESTELSVPTAPQTPATRRPLVSDDYDAETRGRLFREKYKTLRGEYFIFYSHGESMCRKMLNAMGFKERPPEAETNEFRPVEKMALLWCNGTNSGAKRKSGLGYYVVNRLHFRGLIANKCSLARLLREFELNHPSLVPPGLRAASFYPDTVHLNGSSVFTILEFMRRNPAGLFLMKPGHADCGEGIALFRTPPIGAGRGQSLTSLAAALEARFSSYAHRDLIMQRYVQPPLLLDGRKFDLRVYLLLVPNLRCGVRRGLYAFCHPGYVRLACRPYQANSDDPLLHLTNQAVQQRDPAYESVKDSTVWTPDQLNEYINQRRQELSAPCIDWVRRRMYPRIRAILAHVVSLASSSLCDQPMSFELFGCDFLISADFNVWLLELNSDPSLSKHTPTLGRVVTQAVQESICLAVEVLQRAARGQSLSAKRLAGRQDFCRIFSQTNESIARRVLARAGVQQARTG